MGEEDLKDKIHEQYIEIQELNKRVEDLKTINEEHQILNGMLRKENDRLNTIINELEKDMNRDDLSYVETQYVLNKIKELKGEDKE